MDVAKIVATKIQGTITGIIHGLVNVARKASKGLKKINQNNMLKCAEERT
jgi:hypothetical protein